MQAKDTDQADVRKEFRERIWGNHRTSGNTGLPTSENRQELESSVARANHTVPTTMI